MQLKFTAGVSGAVPAHSHIAPQPCPHKPQAARQYGHPPAPSSGGGYLRGTDEAAAAGGPALQQLARSRGSGAAGGRRRACTARPAAARRGSDPAMTAKGLQKWRGVHKVVSTHIEGKELNWYHGLSKLQSNQKQDVCHGKVCGGPLPSCSPLLVSSWADK